jgi:hypothetical protein
MEQLYNILLKKSNKNYAKIQKIPAARQRGDVLD